jgi:hypothetical protein
VRYKARVAEIRNSDTILVREDLTHYGNIMLWFQRYGLDLPCSKLNPVISYKVHLFSIKHINLLLERIFNSHKYMCLIENKYIMYEMWNTSRQIKLTL